MYISFQITSVINYFFDILFAVIGIGLAVRFFKDRYSKKITIKAEILDKYETAHPQVKMWVQTVTDHTVVFDCGGETKKFSVSALAFQGMQKGDKGVLTYRGSHFIGFEHNH